VCNFQPNSHADTQHQFDTFIGILLAQSDKNHRKNWRKRQKKIPNFLKMRIFCVKTGEQFAHFDKNILILKNGPGFLYFSKKNLMIFVSAWKTVVNLTQRLIHMNCPPNIPVYTSLFLGCIS